MLKSLIGRDGISKTVMWKKCVALGNFADAGTFPIRHAGATDRTGLFSSMITNRRRIDAHRAGCSADGGCSTQTLWRNRTGGALADRGTGRAGKRRHAIRQRRFPDLRETRRDLAEGAAPRRLGSRPQRAAHGDAGARAAEMRRRGIRLPAFPSRLLSVLAVLPAADPVSDHPARQARPARAPAGVHHLLQGSGDLDLERAAASGAAGQLGPHHPSRPAGKTADAAAGHARLSRRARPHRAGKGRRSRDQDRDPLRHSAQDRRQGRSRRPGLLRRVHPPADRITRWSNISARSATTRNPTFSAARSDCWCRSTGRSRSASS